MSTYELAAFHNATTESDRLRVLEAAIEESRRNRIPIYIDDEIAQELIQATESADFSDAFKMNVWRAISFCGTNAILRENCENTLHSPDANSIWQDYAFQYLMKNTMVPDRTKYIEYAASSSNYRLQYSAAVQNVDSNTQDSLRRFVDICESRDPYDHGTFEGLTFWIHKKGDASLIPYIEGKMRSSTNPDVVSDLSDWIEMLSAR